MPPVIAPAPVPPTPVYIPPAAPVAAPLLCTYCHQPLLPTYFFCPNCGTKVLNGELSTTPFTQAWIYIFSAILPVMGFIMVTKWPAIKYYRSADEKAKNIGAIAFVIISVSTIITIWLAYVEVQNVIQSTVSGLNADMSASGGD